MINNSIKKIIKRKVTAIIHLFRILSGQGSQTRLVNKITGLECAMWRIASYLVKVSPEGGRREIRSCRHI